MEKDECPAIVLSVTKARHLRLCKKKDNEHSSCGNPLSNQATSDADVEADGPLLQSENTDVRREVIVQSRPAQQRACSSGTGNKT